MVLTYLGVEYCQEAAENVVHALCIGDIRVIGGESDENVPKD